MNRRRRNKRRKLRQANRRYIGGPMHRADRVREHGEALVLLAEAFRECYGERR